MSEEAPQEFTRKKHKTKEEGLWVISFLDLALNLMACFALMLSFSTPDKRKFENITEGMSKNEASKNAKKDKNVKDDANNLQNISQNLMKEIKKQRLDATVVYDANGVAIELKDKLFFRSGHADISDQYRGLTDKLMRIIAKSPNKYKLILEGHTDDVPLGDNAYYRNNWELSSARGVSMLNELRRLRVPDERMSVIAYAHTRPKMAYANKHGHELDEARAANRRVVIRIE